MNFSQGQVVTENGQLPLYHDFPSLLDAMTSGNPHGARKNNKDAAQKGAQVAADALALGNELMVECTTPPPGNPISCGLAMQAYNAVGLAGDAADASDNLQALLSIDGLSAIDQNALSQAVAAAQASAQNLASMGYEISSDGQTVTNSLGQSMTVADLASDKAMLDAGFSQNHINQVKSGIDRIIKNGLNSVQIGGPGASGGATALANRGRNFIVPGDSSGSQGNSANKAGHANAMTGAKGKLASVDGTPNGNGRSLDPNGQGGVSGGLNGSRDTASSGDLNALSVNFNGTQIGVAGASIFHIVSASYQKQNLD